MKAGRDLDALIGEIVMKWPVVRIGEDIPHETATDIAGSSRRPLLVADTEHCDVFRKIGKDCVKWSPSTDIAAAWEVVEKLRPHFNLVLECVSFEYNCHAIPPGRLEQRIHARAETAPLSICLAALKLFEEEV